MTNIDQSTVSAMLADHQDGLSYRRVGSKYNIHPETARRILAKEKNRLARLSKANLVHQWHIANQSTAPQTADHFGLSLNWVHRVLREFGVAAPNKGKEVDRRLALEYYKEHPETTHAELGKMFGLHRVTVTRMLAKHSERCPCCNQVIRR